MHLAGAAFAKEYEDLEGPNIPIPGSYQASDSQHTEHSRLQLLPVAGAAVKLAQISSSWQLPGKCQV